MPLLEAVDWGDVPPAWAEDPGRLEGERRDFGVETLPVVARGGDRGGVEESFLAVVWESESEPSESVMLGSSSVYTYGWGRGCGKG